MQIERNAIVIDNNDADKKDRLQVRVIPEMNDVQDSLLPWVSPKSSNNNFDSINRKIPEVDSIVLIELEDTFEIRNMRWSLNTNVLDNIDYDSIETDVNDITDKVSDYTYPQPNEYHRFKDGSYSFRNTETGELVFCHNSGVYTIYDEDGNVKTYTKDKMFQVYNDKFDLQLKDNGDYSFTNEKFTIDAKNDGNYEVNNSLSKIKIDSSGSIEIDSASQSTEIKCLNCDISATGNINLGGTMALNQVVMNGTAPMNLESLLTSLITHIHPAVTTATVGPTGVVGVVTITPSPALSPFATVPALSMSQTVKTK